MDSFEMVWFPKTISGPKVGLPQGLKSTPITAYGLQYSGCHTMMMSGARHGYTLLAGHHEMTLGDRHRLLE
jgi:hypothetical protein